MSDVALGVLVRPLVVFAMFFVAAVVAFGLRRFIPEGRVKHALYRKRPLGDLTIAAGWLLCFLALSWYVWYMDVLTP